MTGIPAISPRTIAIHAGGEPVRQFRIASSEAERIGITGPIIPGFTAPFGLRSALLITEN